MRFVSPIALLMIFGSLHALLAQEAEEQRIPYTNREYFPGDWVSYTCVRFVYNLAIAPETIYFATTGGIARYDPNGGRWLPPWTVSEGLATNDVHAVAYDVDTGFIWCTTAMGISFRHPTSSEWRNFYKDELGIAWADRIGSIGVGTGQILFETQSGRVLVADKFGNWVEPLDGVEPDGPIFWFGDRGERANHFPMFHMGRGLLFDPEGFVRDFRLREYAITCAQEDAWSQMWIGTWGLGAGRADMRMIRLEMLPFGPWAPEVRALAVDGTRILMGGFGSYEDEWGITIWDRERNDWRYYESRYVTGMAGDRVLVCAAGEGALYFGTDLGLLILDRMRDHWRTLAGDRFLPDDWTYDVLPDESGVWVATRRGVVHLSWVPRPGKEDSLVVDELDPGNLHGVEVYELHRTGNLRWAATSEGLYVWDDVSSQGGYVRDPGGPVGNPIYTVDSFGDTLWVAGWKGVEAYDLSRRMWLPPPAGREDIRERVYRLRASRAAVWVGTENGVYKYNVEDRRWRHFTVRDGLVGSRVYDIVVDGDYVWFATNRGLTCFYWNNPHRTD